jgi:hypothetical protein
MNSSESILELRDPVAARNWVIQGLALARVARPKPGTLAPTLDWIDAILNEGEPLPPVGFVADLGHLAFGLESAPTKDAPALPGWPSTLADNYLHHVLGKFFADGLFERASFALARYDGADRARGLAFLVNRFRRHARLGGITFSNAIVRNLRRDNPANLLAEGAARWSSDGPPAHLVTQYEHLISATRRLTEVIEPEDVVALEQRTALADLSQYVAHRQILTLAMRFENRLPSRPVRPAVGRRDVPTRVLDEDLYPVGGYSSIANRGSIESLLHSQLSYMEPAESPDLFDVKFARDELFYYARDENQFRRRRRLFVFVFQPDLLAARFKDAELPAQRIVLAGAAVLAIVRKLALWLGADALHFALRFPKSGTAEPLADEAELFGFLLRELLANRSASIETVPEERALVDASARAARHSQVHVLELAAKPTLPEPDGTVLTRLRIDGPVPELIDGRGLSVPLDADDAADAWFEAVRAILERWI